MIDISKFKIYFVLVLPIKEYLIRFVEGGIFDRILSSYAYRDNLTKFLNQLDSPVVSKLDILIDSGAYTVMTQGQEVDIDEYIQYLKGLQNEKFASLQAICLDSIPTGFTRKEFDQCARETFENYEYMKNKGIDYVLPVYHAGEDLRWLDKIVESGCKYFAMGGVSGRLEVAKWKRAAFNTVFSRLKVLGYSGKVHMLGLSTARLLLDYPWYSVDAAFHKQPAYGRLYVFDPNKGGVGTFDYSGLKKGFGKGQVRTQVEKDYILYCLNSCSENVNLKEWKELDSYWVRVEAGLHSWRAFEKRVSEGRASGKIAVKVRRQLSMEDNF